MPGHARDACPRAYRWNPALTCGNGFLGRPPWPSLSGVWVHLRCGALEIPISSHREAPPTAGPFCWVVSSGGAPCRKLCQLPREQVHTLGTPARVPNVAGAQNFRLSANMMSRSRIVRTSRTGSRPSGSRTGVPPSRVRWAVPTDRAGGVGVVERWTSRPGQLTLSTRILAIVYDNHSAIFTHFS